MRIIASVALALSICVQVASSLSARDGKALLFLAVATVPAKQMPVDECRGDSSFDAFRARLQKIVKKRDFAALVDILAPDAEYYAAGAIVPPGHVANGKVGFRQKFDNGRDIALWQNLAVSLRLGCFDAGDSRIIPSVPDGLDPSQYLVVVPSSPLREQPSDKSRVKARLSWNVVTNIGEDPPGRFVHASLADGRTGYMRRDQLRNEYEDDNLLIEKRHGRWMITSYNPTEP